MLCYVAGTHFTGYVDPERTCPHITGRGRRHDTNDGEALVSVAGVARSVDGSMLADAAAGQRDGRVRAYVMRLVMAS